MFNLIVDFLVQLFIVICFYSLAKTYGKKAGEAMDALLNNGSQVAGWAEPASRTLVFKHYRLAYLFWVGLTMLALHFMFKDLSALMLYIK